MKETKSKYEWNGESLDLVTYPGTIDNWSTSHTILKNSYEWTTIEDRALIVRSLNSHYQLLEAAKEVFSWADPGATKGIMPFRILVNLKKAIDKAEVR